MICILPQRRCDHCVSTLGQDKNVPRPIETLAQGSADSAVFPQGGAVLHGTLEIHEDSASTSVHVEKLIESQSALISRTVGKRLQSACQRVVVGLEQ